MNIFFFRYTQRGEASDSSVSPSLFSFPIFCFPSTAVFVELASPGPHWLKLWKSTNKEKKFSTHSWLDNRAYLHFARVDSWDLQTSNISIWRYHCLGELAFLTISNQYWLPSDTVHQRFLFISPVHLQSVTALIFLTLLCYAPVISQAHMKSIKFLGVFLACGVNLIGRRKEKSAWDNSKFCLLDADHTCVLRVCM